MRNRSFYQALDDFVEKDIPEQMSLLMRTICEQIAVGVVLKTPVDTGRARGNWFATVNSMSLAITAETDQSGGETISAMRSVITTGVEANPFCAIVIQNNLPYIGRLEEGSSTQAPGGMLGVTMAEVESQWS